MLYTQKVDAFSGQAIWAGQAVMISDWTGWNQAECSGEPSFHQQREDG
jgi:hypothetical protein